MDQKNLVRFLHAGSDDAVAISCIKEELVGRLITDTDIAINSKFSFFTGSSVPAGCVHSRDLRGILLHEMGHTVGLGHTNGYPQTMYPKSKKCSMSMRSWGAGDAAGLRKMY